MRSSPPRVDGARSPTGRHEAAVRGRVRAVDLSPEISVGVEVGEPLLPHGLRSLDVSMEPLTTITPDDEDYEGWEFEPGQEIAAGKYAWALLGDGVRTETWLAWDSVLWAPVVLD